MGRSPEQAGPTPKGPLSTLQEMVGDRSFLWRVWAVLRTAGCWFLLTLLTIGVGLFYHIAAPIAPESRFLRSLERFYVGFILVVSNVDLRSDGLENEEPGKSYIVMANHRSMYDIPAVHYLLGRGRDLRWIGKKEMLRVPVFGWAYGLSRHIAIDRQNRRKGIEALKRAAAASKEGVSFVIMPEGTRSLDGSLGPFKKGGFHLAVDTGLPILPVAIEGSEKLMRKGAWWILHGTITVTVRPAIPTADLTKTDLTPLLERVRAEIQSALPEPAAKQ